MTSFNHSSVFFVTIGITHLYNANFSVDKTVDSQIIPTQILAESGSVAGVCDWTSPPSCLAQPLSTLHGHIHSNHEYQVRLGLHSVTGLSTVVESVVYTHAINPPNSGMVLELDLNDQGAQEVTQYDQTTYIFCRELN